jgi:uncharacterized protein (TIGR04222 family)
MENDMRIEPDASGRAAPVLRLAFPVRLGLLLAILALLPSPGAAQGKVYEITSLQARLELLPSGDYRIREAITFDFQVGEFTFAERNIPASNSDGIGNVRVSSPDVTITAVEQRGRRGGDVRWEFPPASGSVTFVIEYDLLGAVRVVDDTNEVFWRVVGTEWEVPFRDVVAEVVLPASLGVLAPAVSLEPADIGTVDEESGAILASFDVGALDAGDGYQVRVAFPRVMEGRLTGLARPEIQSLVLGLTLLVLLVVAGSVMTYRRIGPPAPPKPRGASLEVSLPVASVLLHRVGPTWERAFPATLFDLAARGLVSIERRDVKARIITSEKTFVHPSDPEGRTAPELTTFESALLDEIGRHETLEDFGQKGRSFRREAMRSVRSRMVEAGYLEDLRGSSNRILIQGGLMLLVGLLGFIAGAAINPLWFLFAGLASGGGLASLLIGSVQFARTQKGADTLSTLRGYLQGIREELKRTAKVAPMHAAQVLFRELPWITLDPRYHGESSHKVEKKLKKEEGRLSAPSWAIDNTRKFAKATRKHSAAYAAFYPWVHVTGAAGGAAAPSAGGGAVGGAAGGGAAGGGGGGAG